MEATFRKWELALLSSTLEIALHLGLSNSKIFWGTRPPDLLATSIILLLKSLEKWSFYFSKKYDWYSKYNLRSRDHCSSLYRFVPKMKVVKYKQSTCKILHSVSKNCPYFLVYFFTCLFRVCISCVIFMQYGG